MAYLKLIKLNQDQNPTIRFYKSKFVSKAVRIEQIVELEFLVDTLKKQNFELQGQIQIKKLNLQFSLPKNIKLQQNQKCNELISKNKLKDQIIFLRIGNKHLLIYINSNLIEDKQDLSQDDGQFKKSDQQK
ncbi:unnamed protein product [Paramecium primaurelia]|uniref:Uncharacterized protein n=1 Tax=Paramecium primaurelia TaxID=5886 RepID=A0A8S1PWC4_PARPR|nr:unnamed protein product [Paramecium primaurelia]